jgi:hypothetical protein
MIERVLDSGVPTPWVTAGETFGADPGLRSWLERRGVPYGLATRSPDRITPGVWARSAVQPAGNGPECERLLLARPTPAGDRLVQYDCRVPAGTTMQALAWVTGTRYRVEKRFARARTEMGLDHYQVRRYDAWYRHVTLCLLAGAYLTAVGEPD